MADIDTTAFKGRLEEELRKLEEELNTVGTVNPSNPADWEPKPSEVTREADRTDKADHIESFEANSAILKELETRYNNVKRALEKIEAGTYGTCEVSGDQIEMDRLEANPSARTCKAHLGELESH